MKLFALLAQALAAIVPEALRAKRAGDRQDVADDAREKAERDAFEARQREKRRG